MTRRNLLVTIITRLLKPTHTKICLSQMALKITGICKMNRTTLFSIKMMKKVILKIKETGSKQNL